MEDQPIWVGDVFSRWASSANDSIPGNVSYEVPGFHGGFYIPADGVNHTPQFTAGAGSEEGFRRSLYCAAGMAVVGCRVLTDDDFASAVKVEFENDK